MRATAFYLPTRRQVSAEAKTAGHELLLRGGFLRQTPQDSFAILPAGMRVLRKLSKLVSKEFEVAGAQEIMLATPASLDTVVACLSQDLSSSRYFPLTVYYFHTPLTHPSRTHRGLDRLREGLVVEVYTFAMLGEDLANREAALRYSEAHIMQTLGLKVLAVNHDVSSDYPTTFSMALLPGGPEMALVCDTCGIARTPEIAFSQSTFCSGGTAGHKMELVITPGAKTVEALCAQLELEAKNLIKTLLCRSGDFWIAALVRGDRQLSMAKLCQAVGNDVRFAESQEITDLTGAVVGFSGPIGLPKCVHIMADKELQGMVDCVVGANQSDAHFMHVDVGRDFEPETYHDLRLAQPGDSCAVCESGTLEAVNGIRVGECISPHDRIDIELSKVSDRMECVGASGYRLDLTSLMVALSEYYHDENGINWPRAVAPFEVVILLLDPTVKDLVQVAITLYEQLLNLGLDVLLDDREMRPGVKFKDADLIGCPVQVVVGNRFITEGLVEIRQQHDRAEKLVIPEEVPKAISKLFCLTQELGAV